MVVDWLAALSTQLATGNDVVLVTVARTQGSTPREAGTTMLVGTTITALTIGGGHLEWQATAHARRLLSSSTRRPEMIRYNLGARLGQCCGGVVWLLYECVPATALPQWLDRQGSVERGESLQRHLTHSSQASTWTCEHGHGTVLRGTQDQWEFIQDIAAAAFPVYLFGAGHVAQALARQLLPLGAALTWIDSREEAFAEIDTAGIQTLVTDTPESEVAGAPPGTFFVIMTHSHTLDFALCEAVFGRRDFAYFGLIGSQSKRASFEHRLLDRGLPRERLEELTCPIGIAGIFSKRPAAIALAVAAELFMRHSARQMLAHAGRQCRIDHPVQPE